MAFKTTADYARETAKNVDTMYKEQQKTNQILEQMLAKLTELAERAT